MTRLFGTVDQTLGRVTALVNNAAMYAGVNRIDDMTPEQLQETFATNIFGYFYAPARRSAGCPRGTAAPAALS